MRRYDPAFVALRDRRRDGELGAVRVVALRAPQRAVAPDRDVGGHRRQLDDPRARQRAVAARRPARRDHGAVADACPRARCATRRSRSSRRLSGRPRHGRGLRQRRLRLRRPVRGRRRRGHGAADAAVRARHAARRGIDGFPVSADFVARFADAYRIELADVGRLGRGPAPRPARRPGTATAPTSPPRPASSR